MVSPTVLGRGTIGKLKRAGLLLAVLLSLGATVLAAYPALMHTGIIRLRQKLLRPWSEQWNSLPANTCAAAVAGRQMLLAGEGYLLEIDLTGAQRWRIPLALDHPEIQTSGSYGAVYTPGAPELILTDVSGAHSLEIPGGVDFAAPDGRGGAAVITSGSGYLTETLLLDGEGTVSRRIGLTGEAMARLCWLEDGGLCYVTVDRKGIWRLNLEGQPPVVLPDELVYDLRPSGSGVALWTCGGVRFYDAAGNLQSRYDLGTETLVDWACGDYAALVVRRNGGWQLMTVDSRGISGEGTVLPRKPDQIMISGGRVCMLDMQALAVYDKNGRLLESISAGSAQRALPLPGAAVLLGEDRWMCHLLK